MNFSIEHVGLPAADSVALKNWYERVLGARELWNNGQTPPTFLVVLPHGNFPPNSKMEPASIAGMWLEIYPANTEKNLGRADNKLSGFRHLALRVDSLEMAKAELEKSGVKFTDEIRPAAGGGKILLFADGDGNLLHLVERAPNFSLEK